VIRYAYPLRIRYNKLSYSLPVHITLTQPIPLFGILYLSDNWFYTYPISLLLVFTGTRLFTYPLCLLIRYPLTVLMYIASDTASDYSVSLLVYKLL